MSYREDNNRIAKNTITLYIRTLFVMLISLYSSRALLDKLGIDNFGIYNLVASVVVLFSFLNIAITQAIQRFISIELGKEDYTQLRKVFKSSITSIVFVIIILFIIVGPFGIWFIDNKLNIPPDYLEATKWVFKFSMLTFAINTFRLPFESLIIANENMSFFAYISILDSFLKLFIILLLNVVPYNALESYACMLTFVALIITSIYISYCYKKYSNYIQIGLLFDKKLLISITTFSGWSLFGSITNVLTQKGFLFLINIFYGLVANAAMGIATQVSGAVSTFINSFQTSFRPQIVKAYAAGDYNRVNNLVARTSKLSFALMILPTLGLIFNMPFILNLWLKEVPDYTIAFCSLILICLVIDATTGPYNCAIVATGKIKKYQIAISLSFILDIVGSYFLMKKGISASYILIMRIITRGFINMLIGLYFIRTLLYFNLKEYFKRTLTPIIITIIVLIPALFILSHFYSHWKLLFATLFYLLTFGIVSITFILLDKDERNYILTIINKKVPMFKIRSDG